MLQQLNHDTSWIEERLVPDLKILGHLGIPLALVQLELLLIAAMWLFAGVPRGHDQVLDEADPVILRHISF